MPEFDSTGRLPEVAPARAARIDCGCVLVASGFVLQAAVWYVRSVYHGAPPLAPLSPVPPGAMNSIGALLVWAGPLALALSALGVLAWRQSSPLARVSRLYWILTGLLLSHPLWSASASRPQSLIAAAFLVLWFWPGRKGRPGFPVRLISLAIASAFMPWAALCAAAERRQRLAAWIGATAGATSSWLIFRATPHRPMWFGSCAGLEQSNLGLLPIVERVLMFASDQWRGFLSFALVMGAGGWVLRRLIAGRSDGICMPLATCGTAVLMTPGATAGDGAVLLVPFVLGWAGIKTSGPSPTRAAWYLLAAALAWKGFASVGGYSAGALVDPFLLAAAVCAAVSPQDRWERACLSVDKILSGFRNWLSLRNKLAYLEYFGTAVAFLLIARQDVDVSLGGWTLIPGGGWPKCAVLGIAGIIHVIALRNLVRLEVAAHAAKSDGR